VSEALRVYYSLIGNDLPAGQVNPAETSQTPFNPSGVVAIAAAKMAAADRLENNTDIPVVVNPSEGDAAPTISQPIVQTVFTGGYMRRRELVHPDVIDGKSVDDMPIIGDIL
jgi:hypothetical protein